MGKTCSKDKNATATIYNFFRSRQNNTFNIGEFVPSRRQSQNLEASFPGPEIRPPHSVLKQSINDLAKTHKFYIHIYGLKARNLKVKNIDTSVTYCVVNWDDFAYERRTSQSHSANPKWYEEMRFYYSVPTLQSLNERYVKLSVYEESGNNKKGRWVGSATVNLMMIASGPLHHDIRLTTNNNDVNGKHFDTGRLILDLRMAQVCQLIISPIEVLVHIHESLDTLDEMEVEGVGTKRPATITAATSTARRYSLPSQESATHPSILSNNTISNVNSVFIINNGSQQNISSNKGNLKTTKQSLSRDKILTLTSPTTNDNNAVDDNDDDRNNIMLSQSSHVTEKEDTFLAEWQLTFLPTGVDNPIEFCSSITSTSDQPYWNSIDHTIVNQISAEAYNKKIKSCTLKKISENEISENEISEKEITIKHKRDGYSNDLSQLPSRSESLEENESVIKILEKEDIKKKNNDDETILLNNIRVKTQLQNVAFSISKKKNDDNQVKSNIIRPSPISPCELIHSMSAVHMHHIDTEATYSKLAATCRSGRLVREMLYDDLPSIQLETTSDFLRQNHLKIRLYARRLGLTEPRFYGEAWLPFFKIYDADVVEQMHQNFSDAYFHEKLWFDGKCIGHIEGIIVFQNNPMVRQMLAGVHTDEGFVRISPSVVEQPKTKSLFKLHEVLPDEMKQIARLNLSLLELLFSKSQHTTREANLISLAPIILPKQKNQTYLKSSKKSDLYNALIGKESPKHSENGIRAPEMMHGVQEEFHNVCDSLLQNLRSSHVETRRSFLYRDQIGLLCGQKVLVTLAEHVLEYADYVPWQFRSTYSAILHLILRRGELDLGSCIPTPPSEIADLTIEERSAVHVALKSVYRWTSKKGCFKCTSLNSRHTYLALQPTDLDDNSLHSCIVTPEIEKIVKSLNSEAIQKIHIYSMRMQVNI